jgi:FKBP-type peptidyl-prolyl cis-trans isomerase SlyD
MESKKPSMHIEKNCVVSIRYIMKNSADEELENTMNALPVMYLHGATGILPLLQVQLEGLKTGDKKLVYLKAASGLTSEDFIFDVTVDEVRPALQEEILLGYPVKLNASECGADCSCYN